MKEKMKSILFVLALALVFVGATKMTEAKAAEDPKVDYATETISVKVASGSVYYQVVKDDKAAVKAANWVPAAEDKENGQFLIDISALSNTKDSYIAYATSPNATEKTGTVPVVAKIKSVKASLDYKEETPNDLYDVIAKLDVKGVAKAKADDHVWPTTTTSDKWANKGDLSTLVTLGWKRGANGAWELPSAFDAVDWQMMKSSNTTLYLRIEKVDLDGDGKLEEYRYSKEAKVKVPKTAKAPSVKVDYKKGTVAIKNGMEFRQKGSSAQSVSGGWITIGVKDSKSSVTDVFNVEKTKTAKSAVTMDELKKQLNVNAGDKVTLEVRTSATDKKFMSNIYELDITLPAAAPTIATTAAEIRTVSGDTITFDFTKLVTELDKTGKKYEYAIANADIDFATSKFTALTSTKLELATSKDVSYKAIGTDGKSKSTKVKYNAATTLWVREVGEYKNAPLKFAGEAAEIKLVTTQQ